MTHIKETHDFIIYILYYIICGINYMQVSVCVVLSGDAAQTLYVSLLIRIGMLNFSQN